MDITKSPLEMRFVSNNRAILNRMIPVTTSDIYNGLTNELHPNGLFSPVIFGNQGEKRRSSTISYIDLRVKILHPILVRNMKKVNAFYYDILMGRGLAIFDKKSGEFVKTTDGSGDTGYHFFMSHWEEIKWKRNESDRRAKRIRVIERYRMIGIYDFYLVIPAGLRDIEEMPDGTVTQDDANDFYRTLIGTSRGIDLSDLNSKYNNQSRVTMQRTAESLYDLYFSYLKGKRGLIAGKWSKRRIDHGTRGVLSALDYSSNDLSGPQTITPNNAVMGLYQTLKAYLPFVVFAMTNGEMEKVFTENNVANLINAKTLKSERVNITTRTRSLWTSFDGINHLVNTFGVRDNRNSPVMVEGKYLALIYRNKRGCRLIFDIDELNGREVDKCKPVTWGELFYYVISKTCHGLPQHVTRYPVNNMNSIVPMTTYIRTTTKGELLYIYDQDWKLTDAPLREMPIVGTSYTDVTPVHPTKYEGMGADNDGDQVGNNSVLTDDAIGEVNTLLSTTDHYFNVEGDLAQNFNTYPFKLFLLSTTGLVKFDENGNPVK